MTPVLEHVLVSQVDLCSVPLETSSCLSVDPVKDKNNEFIFGLEDLFPAK